jgi:hypothetical protein
MNLHREFLKNGRKLDVARESKATSEEISENNNLVRLRSRSFFIRWGTTITRREKPSFFIFLDEFSGNFRFAENKS